MTAHIPLRAAVAGLAVVLYASMLPPGAPTAGAQMSDRSPTLYDFITVDTIATIDIPDFMPNDGCTFVNDEGAYFYPSQHAAGDTSTLYRVDHLTGAMQAISVILPDTLNIDSRNALNDFAVDDRLVVMLTWKALMICRKNADGTEARCEGVIPLPRSYQSVRLLGGRCFLSVCAFFDGVMERQHTYLALADLDRARLLWEKTPADPEGAVFTFFRPRSVLDCSGSEIVISDITRYRIGIYDMTLKRVATLERRPERWTAMEDTSYRKLLPVPGAYYNAKELMSGLGPHKEIHTLIKRVDFLNDSTLLVSWVPGVRTDYVSRENRRTVTLYDIWRRGRSGWRLLAADLESQMPPLTDTFSISKRWPMSYQYVCGGSHLLGIDPLPINLYGNKTLATIGREIQDYYAENDFRYSYLLFRLTR